jgi:hypothetical protein
MAFRKDQLLWLSKLKNRFFRSANAQGAAATNIKAKGGAKTRRMSQERFIARRALKLALNDAA